MRTLLLVLALVLLAPAAAQARQHRFAGGHPIARDAGGGYCYIEAPHVHVYGPHERDVLYRPEGDWNRFVGDPVAYGYEGPRFVFHGAHPVHSGPVVHYCYLKGDHFHDYQPEEAPGFTVKGGVYFYVGEFPRPFYEARPKLARINAVYQPIRYSRPAVVVEPPEGYVDVLFVDAPRTRAVVVEHPHAEAHVGVGVEVHLPPPPVLELRVGVPGVVVEDHHHHDVHVIKHKHRGKHKGHWRGRGWRH